MYIFFREIDDDALFLITEQKHEGTTDSSVTWPQKHVI